MSRGVEVISDPDIYRAEWLAQQHGFASQEGRYFLGWVLLWPPYRGAEVPVAARSLPDSASSGASYTAEPSMEAGGTRAASTSREVRHVSSGRSFLEYCRSRGHLGISRTAQQLPMIGTLLGYLSSKLAKAVTTKGAAKA
jgi:hypothetical protein